MKNTNWREIVEIVGVVSIVASVLLLAMEVRQANQIAGSELELNLQQGFMQMNHERASNPAFAQLFAKTARPTDHLITATEREQMRGLAWHYVNICVAAQSAFDNDLLSDSQFKAYADGLQWTIDNHPGLHPHFVAIYESFPTIQEMRVFAPLRELVEAHRTSNQ
ncbi:MAG: hypothetical protein R3358_05455 [Woeseiaceae bacterium]|nr:hypothetical protein [Woeseiaceae bacterium]